MSETLSSPWLPCLVLVGLAILARQIRGSWLSPGAFVALVWATYVVACLMLTDYTIYACGIWVVVLFVFSVQFGTLISQGLDFRRFANHEGMVPDWQTLSTWERQSLRFSLIFAAVALIGCIRLLIVSLDKFSVNFSLLEVLSLGHLWSVARYEHGELEPWSVRLLIMWVYPAVLLAGISFASARSRLQRWLTIAPLLPATLVGTMFAARAGLLISVICWSAGLFAVRYRLTRGRYALFQRKLLLSLSALALSGLLFFVTIDAVRVFQGGNFELATDLPRLSKYCLGSLPAFADWFHTSTEEDATMGTYTFAGVFDLLGMKQRQIGVYEQRQALSGGEETNIYTALRGLVQDFTLPGTSLFGVLLGIFAGTASRSKSTNHLQPVLVLAAYYAFTIFSPLSSLFTYNGLILAWCGAAVVLIWPTRQDMLRRAIVASPVQA